MERNYLHEPLSDQLLGNTCAVVPFSAAVLREHKRLIQEGDSFAAVSVHYPAERYELRAHAQHRYQWIISEAVLHLHLPVWHLKHQKVWFNFYGDLVRRFGSGTQGYTTETELPHIGLSEISMRDPEVLQMVLLHEAQHATDYAFYDGFAMAISERELRARLTVCQAIKAAKGTGHGLYQTAVLDVAQWFLLFCLSRSTNDDLRAYYFSALDSGVQRLLRRGVRFTPSALIILEPELTREGLQLQPDRPYAVVPEEGWLSIRADQMELPLPEGTETAAGDPGAEAGGGGPSPESAIGEEEAPALSPPDEPTPPEAEAVAFETEEGRVDYYPGAAGRPPSEVVPEGIDSFRGREKSTLNCIDDWYNFPLIHQQLTERALVITDTWAKYDIDPTLPLPHPTPPSPIFKTHQELFRYKTGTGPLPPGRKQPS